MEIKIDCACGTRYKFEVEPVNGFMPTKVTCPACGAIGTDRANQIIQQTLADSGATPVAPAAPIAVAASPEPAAPKPGLRISAAPAHTPTAAPPPAPVAPLHPPGGYRPQAAAASKSGSGQKIKTICTVIVSVVVLAIVGFKVFKIVRGVYQVATAISGAADEVAEYAEWNLWADDASVLFVKGTNQTEVANLCAEFYKTKLNTPVKTVPVTSATYEEADDYVGSPHNGCLEVVADLKLKKEDAENLAQYLSDKLKTLVILDREISFTGAYVFAVFDQGAKKFRAELDVKMKNDEPEETMKTEGNEWALANGFVPGYGSDEGSKEFNQVNANAMTKHLGIKLWDKDYENAEKQTLILLKK